MRKRKCLLLVVFSLVIINCTPNEHLRNDAGGFAETFDDPELSGWEHSDTATVSGGALHLETNGFAFRPGSWDDYTLSAQFRLKGQGMFVIEYRMDDAGSYMLEVTEKSLAVKRKVGAETAQLSAKEIIIAGDADNQIQIQTAGGQQNIFLNGNQALSLEEDDPQLSGGVLLRVEGKMHAQVLEISLQLEGADAPADSSKKDSKESSAGKPAFEAESWLRLGGPPGGLGYDIRMRPDNPDIMFVTDANAGIHKSTDGGLTWEAKNEGIGLFITGGAPVFCATIDPFDYDTIWIGMQGLGHVFRSTDNGETWQQRDTGIEPEGRSIRGITIDPNNPDVVYVGLEVSSYVWNGEPLMNRFDLTQGEVYKSTDRGETWKRIWVGDNLARYVWVDPRDSDRIYVSTGIFDRDAANSDVFNGVWGGVGILRSEDGGETWTVLNEQNGLGGLYVPSLYMHPQNPDILLAAVTNSSNAPGLYVTRDGGDEWELILASQPGFGMEAVEISESNPDIWYTAAESQIWRSDDAGKNWERFEIRIGNRLAGMPIDLQADPRDPMRIFVNNYGGGNFLSVDGGQTWMDASKGYTGIGDLESVTVSFRDPALVFARNFQSQDGGLTWDAIAFNFNGSTIIRQHNEQDSVWMVADSSGHVRISKDGGLSWPDKFRIVDIQAGMQAGTLDLEAYPMRAMANSPAHPEVVYAGFTRSKCLARLWYECLDVTPGLYRSEDGGEAWKHLEVPPGDISVLGITVDKGNSQHVFIGTGDGLYESINGGESWTRNTALDKLTKSIYIHPEKAQEGMEKSMILDVKMDPFDSQVLYVSSTPGGVYRSQDGGGTWEHSPAGMDPNEIIYSILPDPNRKGVIYASSAFSGVFVSVDGGRSWRVINDGLTFINVRGISLSADGSVLYAGAEGGGVFRLGTP